MCDARPTAAGCWFALLLMAASALAGAVGCALVYSYIARIVAGLWP